MQCSEKMAIYVIAAVYFYMVIVIGVIFCLLNFELLLIVKHLLGSEIKLNLQGNFWKINITQLN